MLFLGSPVVMFLRLSGHTLISRVQASTDLVGCVLDSSGSLDRHSRVLGGGHPPGSNPPWGGWVYCLAPETPLFRRMPTEPVGRIWATALRSDPPKKGLVPHTFVWLGVRQIPLFSCVSSMSIFVLQCIIIILFIWKFFPVALTDGFRLESEWQQIISDLQYSCQYSSCSLDGLHSSFYFQVIQSLYQSFGDRTECANYYRYHSHFNVP